MITACYIAHLAQWQEMGLLETLFGMQTRPHHRRPNPRQKGVGGKTGGMEYVISTTIAIKIIKREG